MRTHTLIQKNVQAVSQNRHMQPRMPPQASAGEGLHVAQCAGCFLLEPVVTGKELHVYVNSQHLNTIPPSKHARPPQARFVCRRHQHAYIEAFRALVASDGWPLV